MSTECLADVFAIAFAEGRARWHCEAHRLQGPIGIDGRLWCPRRTGPHCAHRGIAGQGARSVGNPRDQASAVGLVL